MYLPIGSTALSVSLGKKISCGRKTGRALAFQKPDLQQVLIILAVNLNISKSL